MRPSAPLQGKKVLMEFIRPLWKVLSFSKKITIRNIFRYKKRMMMTLIGIIGCTVLMITGFGIKNSISNVMDLQFNNIYKFDSDYRIKRCNTNSSIYFSLNLYRSFYFSSNRELYSNILYSKIHTSII